MVTPLPDVNRRHVIVCAGYGATHEGHVFQARIGPYIADECVVPQGTAVFMIVEHGGPVNSKNRGVIVDSLPNEIIYIVDREDPDTVLHQVRFEYEGHNIFNA